MSDNKANSGGLITEGQPAPDFSLPAFPEGVISLSDFHAKQNVVLYFYPRDNTPGCTTEACEFRDNIARLQSAGTAVLGVSTDNVASHQKFAEKFQLPFPLLADENHEVAEQFGVWVEKNMYGRKSMGVQRATFLIDREGTVVKVWPKVSVKGHVDEVAAAVEALA
ncbi:MAG: thioredoxin-dependent thiol peroxidase [Planctomycetaceae bacterium]|nr:thioredoxin-dependent thiol peroxidase [Planctomycetaceae bacterium]